MAPEEEIFALGVSFFLSCGDYLGNNLVKGEAMPSETSEPSSPDYVLMPRPRSLARMLLDVLRLRTTVTTCRFRSDTITAVTKQLAVTGTGGQIISREAGTEWSVAITPVRSDSISGLR